MIQGSPDPSQSIDLQGPVFLNRGATTNPRTYPVYDHGSSLTTVIYPALFTLVLLYPFTLSPILVLNVGCSMLDVGSVPSVQRHSSKS